MTTYSILWKNHICLQKLLKEFIPARVYDISYDGVGMPSTMTKEDYSNYLSHTFAGIGTIQSIDVINFNRNIISVIITLTNGEQISTSYLTMATSINRVIFLLYFTEISPFF